MIETAEQIYSFADFQVDAKKRRLSKDGQTIALNPKAFDLLLALIENRGQIVRKEELLEKVWANQFVEENNLTVHVSALRKIFGEKKGEHRFIVTVPGKGYRFVGELNDDSNGEIIIENHKIERITINEEIQVPPEISKQLPVRQNSFRHLFIVSSIFLAMTAIGGGYFGLNGKSSNGVPFLNSSVRQLTTNGTVGLAALSPDGKSFAYTTNDLGQRSLWLGYVDGGNHLPLRPAAAVYYDLAFSPDGRRLYFSYSDDKNPQAALYKMPVLGGVAEKVLDEITDFSLSPDGGKIAFSRNDAGNKKESLLIADLNTAEKREIISLPKSYYLSAIKSETVSWSPDGERLAFSGVDNDNFNSDIVTVEISSGKLERLKSDVWRDISKTAWTVDGNSLIITAVGSNSWASVVRFRILHLELASGKTHDITTDRSSYGASLSLSAKSDLLLSIEHRQLNNVWIAPVEDLSQARQITFSSFGRYDGLWGMDFTPDGKIIYTNSDTESQFISQMNADGTEPKPLTASGLIDSVLNVSNDGRYIVFHSNRSGGYDIWRMNADGGNPVKLTFGRQNFQPFVSADNLWVYYKSWENGAGELRRVSIEGGEPEILNDKETSWLSFSPDGRYFAASYKTDKYRLAVFDAATNQIIRQFDLPKNATLSIGTRWSPDSRAVAYRDWNDGYWLQAVEGGEPQKMAGLPKEKFYNFAWSKDGRQFAFVRGQEMRDVVLLQAAADK
ncbi:MAG: winged helix-turn-helix domain-containing protein [Pyrinomonadaceae bacterium]|nr:winged helix-turn-helix domain-containing protein [Pyrinomonadaceae bacterium]